MRARFLGYLAAAVLAGLLAATTASAAEKRVALVIGNGAYTDTTQLANPANDAGDVAAALGGLGFEVVSVIDGDYTNMRRAFRRFASALSGADVALFFYAGHGMQVSGRNYMLPVNANIRQEGDLEFEAFAMDMPLGLMDKSGAGMKLVILDACRDNPLSQVLARSIRSTGRSTQVGRGLAKIESAVGTLIAYATGPGDVAADGTGRNSPFTTGLLQWINEPAVEVRSMFGRVREVVYSETKGQQVPWVNESLIGEFYFNPAPPVAPQPTEVAKPAVSVAPEAVEPAPSATRSDHEALFWQSIQDSDRAEDYQEYLKQFPGGTFAGLARSRIDAFRDQQSAAAAVPAPPPAPAPGIELEPIDAPYIAIKNANVRREPSVRSPTVATLHRGTQVNVAAKVKDDDWYLIEDDNGYSVGYVYAELLQDAATVRQAEELAAQRLAEELAAQRLAAPPSFEPEPTTAALPFQGVYDGFISDGINTVTVRAVFRRQGNEVEAEYSSGDSVGYLYGLVMGDVLLYEWQEGGQKGRGMVRPEDGGNTLQGVWGYGDSYEGAGVWQAFRTQ
jgi:uncharacterized caspase-like protein